MARGKLQKKTRKTKIRKKRSREGRRKNLQWRPRGQCGRVTWGEQPKKTGFGFDNEKGAPGKVNTPMLKRREAPLRKKNDGEG